MTIYKATITIEIYKTLKATYYVEANSPFNAMELAKKQAIGLWEYDLLWEKVYGDYIDEMTYELHHSDDDWGLDDCPWVIEEVNKVPEGEEVVCEDDF